MGALREVKTLDASDRVALARSVLARAESAHGTTVHALGVPTLPVADQIATLLPHGGLHCGAVTVLQGSTAFLLTLLSRASQEGSWCAVVGFPEIGSLAAAEAGIDLSRLALIPDPGQQVGQVLAALTDGLDVVVVGPQLDRRQLRPAVQRQIAARVKERGVVLISLQEWSGAEYTLQAHVAGWRGMGRGYGHLTKQDLILGRGGRGAAQRHISAEVSLPLAAV